VVIISIILLILVLLSACNDGTINNNQNILINGLAYNSINHSLIPIQQLGRVYGSGYINKFIANGANA
jgi:hypothetical protein